MTFSPDRIVLLALSILFTVGCVECLFRGQPDCIGSHTIVIEDAQGVSLSNFDALLSVPSIGVMIEITCREEMYNSSEDHVCTSKGINIRHFDEPIEIEIKNLEGTQQARETFELSITPASDECTCAAFETHTMTLTP